MLPSVAAGVREKRERNKTIGNILLQVWRKKEYNLVLLADKNLIVFNNFLFLLNFKSLFRDKDTKSSRILTIVQHKLSERRSLQLFVP